VSRIDIHSTVKEPDRHIVRVAPVVSRMAIIGEVPTKSNLGPYSQDEVLAPSDTRTGCHPGLSHSHSNKPPRCREVRFNKVVTRLLGLSCPIKPDIRSVQIKACHRSENDRSLIDTGGSYHTETSE
jgi:hypothetical protein